MATPIAALHILMEEPTANNLTFALTAWRLASPTVYFGRIKPVLAHLEAAQRAGEDTDRRDKYVWAALCIGSGGHKLVGV